jgi:hypothetical protein
MYLNFSEISKIPFQKVLEWLEIPYTQTQDGKLTGQGFIITIKKNLFFNPTGEDKGSIINFVANYRDMSLRDAAALLHNEFLIEHQIPEYDLHYCEFLEKEGIPESTAKEWEVGLVKNHKGPAAGRIAFKIRDIDGNKVGYALYNPKDGSYFYFRGYKHDHIYGLHRVQKPTLYQDPLSAVKNDAISLTYTGLTEAQEKALIHRLSALELSSALSNLDNLVKKLVNNIYIKTVG